MMISNMECDVYLSYTENCVITMDAQYNLIKLNPVMSMCTHQIPKMYVSNAMKSNLGICSLFYHVYESRIDAISMFDIGIL